MHGIWKVIKNSDRRIGTLIGPVECPSFLADILGQPDAAGSTKIPRG